MKQYKTVYKSIDEHVFNYTCLAESQQDAANITRQKIEDNGWKIFDYKLLSVTEVNKVDDNKEDKHPLINPDSKHYSMIDGIEAIERLEGMYTIEELMIWSKISAMKYRLRIGNKDDAAKEAKKIKTFEDYYEYLENQSYAG